MYHHKASFQNAFVLTKIQFMFHIFTNGFCWDTTNYFVFSDILYYCCICSNNRIVSNFNLTKYFCTR
ncbi:Uncharacterised protein [uncultured Faecalibacterium sp.]|nr:Uncharacterised protein [uncultured Faecalibacterium sp.]